MDKAIYLYHFRHVIIQIPLKTATLCLKGSPWSFTPLGAMEVHEDAHVHTPPMVAGIHAALHLQRQGRRKLQTSLHGCKLCSI